MKKITTLLFVLLLASCTSKEQKIQKMIEDDLFRTLHDFKSYEPIETKIDSAYFENYMIPEVMSCAYKCLEHFDKYAEYIEEAANEQKYVEIWESSKFSFGRDNYIKAFEKMNSAIDKFQKERGKINEIHSEIRKLIAEHKSVTPEFIGWKAIHRFRCNTKGGTPNIVMIHYIIDKDFKEIIYQEEPYDEEMLKAKIQIDHALTEKSVRSEKAETIIKTAMAKKVKEYEPLGFGDPEETESGWKVLHKYTGLNKSGKKETYHYVFHFDKNVTKVIRVNKD
jgi:hypothetical protein